MTTVKPPASRLHGLAVVAAAGLQLAVTRPHQAA